MHCMPIFCPEMGFFYFQKWICEKTQQDFFSWLVVKWNTRSGVSMTVPGLRRHVRVSSGRLDTYHCA